MRTAAILLFLLLVNSSFGAGLFGTYLVNGYMYDKASGKVLANQQFKFKNQIFETDSAGHYEFEVNWSTPCPSAPRYFWKRINNNGNDRYLIISHQSQSQRISNRWKNSGPRAWFRNAEGVRTKNFYW